MKIEAKHRIRRILSACAVMVGLALFVSDAQAQNAAARRKAGRNVIKLDTTVIEGTIQKPQAFYILQRSSLNLEGLELKNSFIPKIIKSVEKPPF